jgi:hypothetical protein
MEIAGVGIGVVGLAGLVSTCLDVLERVDTYKAFGSDAQSLSLCFEADKHRFRQWLQTVGFVNGRLADAHNPLLDDPALKPLVYKILSHVCSIWGVGSARLSALEIADLGKADALPRGGGGGDGKLLRARKPTNPTRPSQSSKRTKIGWALGGGKAKFMTQLESFEALVNRLYSLVPPAGMGVGPAAGSPTDAGAHKNPTEGKLDRQNSLLGRRSLPADTASLEHRRLISEMRDFLKRK